MNTLIVQYYQSQNPDRQAELDEAFRRNLANPQIDRIVSVVMEDMRPPEPHEKVQVVRIKSYPTYADLFDQATDDVNIAANSDIVFDETLSWLDLLHDGHVWCLTRYDDGVIHASQCSSDVWAFRGRCRVDRRMSAAIEIGRPRCDYRITGVFYEAGYKVLNPSKTVFVHHLHRSEFRTWDRYNIPACRSLVVYSHSLFEQEKAVWMDLEEKVLRF